MSGGIRGIRGFRGGRSDAGMMLFGTALALLVVAMLYASVGHGGASGYLAVLAVAGHPPEVIRPTALILNVLVSGVALVRFAGRGYFRWRTFWPFAATAVPAAFLAGWHWSLDAAAYRIVLGLVLLFAAWRLSLAKTGNEGEPRPVSVPIGMLVGVGIGAISGLIGVGGGIFLSPILLFGGWATARESAAVAAAFVLVSSLAGLGGVWMQYETLPVEAGDLAVFAVAVGIGAVIGSTLGVSRFNPVVLRWALAVVLAVAAAKLILQL